MTIFITTWISKIGEVLGSEKPVITGVVVLIALFISILLYNLRKKKSKSHL